MFSGSEVLKKINSTENSGNEWKMDNTNNAENMAKTNSVETGTTYTVELWNRNDNTVKKTHNGQKRYYCIDCGKSFTRKSSLIVHQRTHTGEKLFMCSECGKRFGLKSSMVRHMRIHTKTINICPECGKCFTRYPSLLHHQKVHRKEKTYKYSTCEKRFLQASQLVIRHRTNNRKDLTEELEFGESGYGFERVSVLEKAEATNMFLECGKRFREPRSLDRHQRTQTVKTAFPANDNDRLKNGSSGKVDCIASQFLIKKISFNEIKNKSVNAKNRTHCGEKRFLCTECGKSFTRKSSLIVHQRTHTGEKLFMCSECGKRFGLKSSMVRHMRTHCPKILNICPDCGKGFDCYSSLFQHQKIHRREKFHKCSHCGKSFSRASQLVVHQRTHRARKSYVKPGSGEGISNLDKLNNQPGACSTEESHECIECGKCFRQHSAFIRHQRMHNAGTKCSLHSSNHLFHTNLKGKTCSSFPEHIHRDEICIDPHRDGMSEAVNDDPEPPNQNILQNPCTETNLVANENRNVCKGMKSFLCIECGKSFTRKSSLIVHHRTHTGEKLFVCSECGKRFGLKSSMVRHMRTHCPKILNICPDCGKGFSCYSSLFQHQKIHRREKVYKCSPCDKSFSRASQLVVHQRKHKVRKLCPKTESEEEHCPQNLSAEVSRICLQCGKWFQEQSTFLRHQRIHKTNLQSSPFMKDANSDFQDWEKETKSISFSVEENIDHLSDHNAMDIICKTVSENHSSESVSENEYSINMNSGPNQRFSGCKNPYNCIECGKTFTRKSSLIVHQRVHTGEKRFTCTACGKRFGFKSSLVRHLRTHTGQAVNICSECGIYFSRYRDLLSHLEKHMGQLPMNYSFVSEREPKQNPLSDTDQSLGRIEKVEVTLPEFKEQDSYLLDKEHRNQYPLPNASPPANDYVHAHYDDTGDKIQQESMNIKQESPEDTCIGGQPLERPKNEQFLICPYSFDWGVEPDISKSLTEESSRKMEKRKESENHMDKSMADGLDNVILGISQEKRFLCTECGKSFTRKSSLVVHQRTHTGEKLFMCSTCGKRFGLKSSMVRHMKIHCRVSH